MQPHPDDGSLPAGNSARLAAMRAAANAKATEGAPRWRRCRSTLYGTPGTRWNDLIIAGNGFVSAFRRHEPAVHRYVTQKDFARTHTPQRIGRVEQLTALRERNSAPRSRALPHSMKLGTH